VLRALTWREFEPRLPSILSDALVEHGVVSAMTDDRRDKVNGPLEPLE
jgi:hypothetical protein